MSDMRTLLEAVTKFSFANPDQKPGDQVRGTEKAKTTGNQHPFKGRLVGTGESVDHDNDNLEESLMYEYKLFVEADPLVSNVSAQGTTTGNASPTGNTAQQPASTAATQNPQQPQQAAGQPAQQPQQAAADLAQSKSELTSNLPQLKAFANQSDDPQLKQMNIPKTVDALTKDPTKLTPTDGQNLAKLAGIVKPVLAKSTGVSQLKGVLRTQQQQNQGQQ